MCRVAAPSLLLAYLTASPLGEALHIVSPLGEAPPAARADAASPTRRNAVPRVHLPTCVPKCDFNIAEQQVTRSTKGEGKVVLQMAIDKVSLPACGIVGAHVAYRASR